MPKRPAFERWRRLTPEDREAALKALGPFKEFLRSKPDHPVVYAERWLSQRRFEQWLEPEPDTSAILGMVAIRRGTPQWDAWAAYRRRTLGKGLPDTESWLVAAEWPPDHQPQGTC